jgi:hypothetical protein
MIGHHVKLAGVTIDSAAKQKGFWLRGSGGTKLFVLPASGGFEAAAGQSVSIGIARGCPRDPRFIAV